MCENCKYFKGTFGDFGTCANKESEFYRQIMLSNAKYCSVIKLMEENSMKTFIKKDLRSGDVVIHRNEQVGIVILEHNAIVYKDGYNLISELLEDLTSSNPITPSYDIMEVYRPNEPFQCQFSASCFTRGELVYERKEVEEMTLEEVCKALGKEIKIVKEKRYE